MIAVVSERVPCTPHDDSEKRGEAWCGGLGGGLGGGGEGGSDAAYSTFGSSGGSDTGEMRAEVSESKVSEPTRFVLLVFVLRVIFSRLQDMQKVE